MVNFALLLVLGRFSSTISLLPSCREESSREIYGYILILALAVIAANSCTAEFLGGFQCIKESSLFTSLL